jgi:hypothetical protein
MRILLSLLVVAAVSVPAGNYRLERPLPVYGTDELLQYDDGSANWLTWSGTYRGTWFDLYDFTPSPYPEWLAGSSELWFYHHSSYPWDTQSFYCEIWNGGIAGPDAELNQTSVTAIHYSPCYATYNPGIWCDLQFWIIVNTEMSSGGWPSVIGDNTPGWTGTSHSYFSDDFVVWEPWIIQGPISNDYFIRSLYGIGLDETTWAAIKTLF